MEIADARAEDLIRTSLPAGAVDYVLPIRREACAPDFTALEGQPLKLGLLGTATARPSKIRDSEGGDSKYEGQYEGQCLGACSNSPGMRRCRMGSCAQR